MREKEYNEKMTFLRKNRIGGVTGYNAPLDRLWIEWERRLPESLDEVFNTFKDYWRDAPDGIDEINNLLVDLFSRKGEWIGYFPIFDSLGKQIVSYVLLSAGIDGKLDNVIYPPNALRIDNWKQMLRLYNPDEFDDGYYLEELVHRPYCAQEARHGDKDLLIHVFHLGGILYEEEDFDVPVELPRLPYERKNAGEI